MTFAGHVLRQFGDEHRTRQDTPLKGCPVVLSSHCWVGGVGDALREAPVWGVSGSPLTDNFAGTRSLDISPRGEDSDLGKPLWGASSLWGRSLLWGICP